MLIAANTLKLGFTTIETISHQAFLRAPIIHALEQYKFLRVGQPP